VGAPAREFFYPGPLLLNPRAYVAILPLFGLWLRPLRIEPTRAQEAANVIRVVGDLEALADDFDDPSARPQARAVTGRLWPRHYHAYQRPSLRHRQLRRSPRHRAGAETGLAAHPVGPFPAPHRPAIHSAPIGDHVHANIALQRWRAIAVAPARPGSPVGAWAPPTRHERALLMQMSLVALPWDASKPRSGSSPSACAKKSRASGQPPFGKGA
jgi:hypothetical protein